MNNLDIRVDVDFWDHTKTLRLIKKLGIDAAVSLQRLWGYAAKHRPDGALSGMSMDDIEQAAKWNGEHGAFFSAIKKDWLDRSKSKRFWILHDWREHNPWVANSEVRKEDGRKGAHISNHSKKNRFVSTCKYCRLERDGEENAGAVSPRPHRRSARRSTGGDTTAPAPAPAPIPAPIAQRAREAADAWNRRAQEFGKPAVDLVEADVVSPFVEALTDRILTIRPEFTWTAAIERIHPRSWIVTKAAHFSFAWLTKDGPTNADLNAVKALDGKYSAADDSSRQFEREGDDPVFDAKGRARRVVE